MKRICAADKCTGCSACANRCPQKCIQMQYDDNGFLYPSISEDCIDCHLCEKVCPANHPVSPAAFRHAFLARSNDETILLERSSSGGMFTELALQILCRGGVVFGAEFSADFLSVHHRFVDQAADLLPLRGSKYIQSEIQNTFKEAKDFLKRGVPVLFCGTPCQIAGLKAYLKQDFPLLITADLMCHGVASTKMYRQFLVSRDLQMGIRSVDFRSKENGYGMQCLLQIQTGQTLFAQPWYETTLGFAFANNLISRESCGTCPYASDKRVSDITLADYVSEDLEAYEQKVGASLVLLNTDKGAHIFEAVGERLWKRELNRADVMAQQQHLRHPAVPHQNRKKGFAQIDRLGYDMVAEKYFTPYKPVFSLKRKWHTFIKRIQSDRSGNHV